MSETRKITTRKQLGNYVRHMANLMGLRDWMLVLAHDEPDEPRHGACVSVTAGQQYATMHFRKDWVDGSPDVLRQTVCHELLHCFHNPMRFVLDLMEDHVARSVLQYAGDVYNEMMELTVDNIARVGAETLPLPILAVTAVKPSPIIVEGQDAA